jgi:hypothetical protein
VLNEVSEDNERLIGQLARRRRSMIGTTKAAVLSEPATAETQISRLGVRSGSFGIGSEWEFQSVFFE